MKTRIQDEAEFQDNRTKKGGALRKFNHLISDAHPFLVKLIGDVKNKHILTMGCATGGVTPFARKGAFVVGIDISHESLTQLNKAIKNEKLSHLATVFEMDCESLAFKSESFDVILFIGVLHHLDIKKTLSECHRILKPGGSIFLLEPLGLHPIVNFYRWITPKLRTKFEHPLRPNDFAIIKSDYEIIYFKGFCLFSIFSLVALYVFRNEKAYLKLRNLLCNIDDYFFKYVPQSRYFAWSAAIKIEKKEDILTTSKRDC